MAEIKTALDNFGVRSMSKIAKILLDDVHQHFTDEGSDVGGWEPHAPATVKRWGVHRLLRLRNRLYRSFKPIVGTKSVYINTNDPKFRFHQYGTKYMPAREMLYISAKAFDVIFAIPMQEIDMAMRK